uniref:Uncharacterized protein n=1 Tax=Rhodnius prolixus TaxID=13249 RepID=T1HRF3_RHOPR
MAEKSFCRLCALKSDNYIKVFEQQGKHLQLAEKIKQCLQIWLMPEDLLPNTVCLTCCEKVNEYSNFYALCIQSQTSLMELLGHHKDNMMLNSESESLENREVPSEMNVEANNVQGISIKDVKSQEKGLHEVSQKNKEFSPSKQFFDKIDRNEVESPKHPAEDNGDEFINEESSFEDKDVYDDTGWFKNYFEVRPPVNTRKMMEGYVWKCSNCDKEMPSRSALKLHYYQEHKQAPSFKCMDCDKAYTRYRSFVRHVKLHWNNECYSCNICGKDFSQKGILQSHMTAHSEERPFVCSECGKAFKQYSSLYLHSKCHLPEEAKPKFPCKICTKVFCSKHAMETHMKIHTGEKNFICDICGKRFIAKGSLDYHIKTHDERKPHSCKICNKSFKTTRLLSKHAMLHTGQKPHQCDVHRRQHTGERPYQCAICHREFTNWANYNKHTKRRHKPGSEGESENEITGQINQQSIHQSILPQQQDIPDNGEFQSENINNVTSAIGPTPTVQDVFSLEPSLYDNVPLDLAEPLSDLYRVPPTYTASVLPPPPTAVPSSSAPPLQLYYLHRYIRYPDFIPTVSSQLLGPVVDETSIRPRFQINTSCLY